MSAVLATRGSLLVDDELRTHASEALSTVGDEEIEAFTLRTSTGRSIEISGDIAGLMAHVLSRVAQGGELAVQTLPETLTTSTAADTLGVSRTTLMKLIAKGELRSTMVGSHHRLRHSEVVALREKREAAQNAAIEELLSMDDDS
ncbi:excisionase family DNA-binding protein [Leucobacter triazinivorans]|uniref:Helix-turn-helix domain-containing protein n=1 Tax=Leucobacter triazinivorans TaxID=1784719 RepID=A0A4P6KDE8_9MICO|nr:excisionase family DNA-binding protein [Leucobacter triazinivorans]QBE48396.1 helix-turn-helix domain-containing protein [Leucobacter triazinivorans]